ncbi:hypothetical protein [Myxococcus hansupus]|nr:hypothetical protein [Myxococcus hansupus]
MSRTVFAAQALRGGARWSVKQLLVVSLAAWGGGCAVEDPVARLRGADAGTGSFSDEDEEAQGVWLESGDVPPDCVPPDAEPDSGVVCEDAGTPDVPSP